MPSITRRSLMHLLSTAGSAAGLVGCQSTDQPHKSTVVPSLPVATPSTLPTEALEHIRGVLRSMGGYDLEETDLGPYPVPGWEGLPTRLYRYVKTDADGTRKPGLAVMLNPSKEQVGRWIVQAIIEARGSYDPARAQALARIALKASTFQFIVRGVHWENMKDESKFIAYPFRDGVTVTLKRFGAGYPSTPLTEAELRYTIECTEDEVITTQKYARIQSTTREEYRSHGGRRDTTGHLWRSVVRDLYKAAWGQDRNELMTARAKSLA